MHSLPSFTRMIHLIRRSNATFRGLKNVRTYGNIGGGGGGLRLHRIALHNNNNTFQDNDGAPSPIVVMHGLFGNSLNWKGVMTRVLEGLPHDMRMQQRVFLVDARNHGESPWHPSMQYEDMSNDLLRLLDDEGIEKATIMGHSMGGKAAMHFMLRHKERVDRGVIVDISPASYVNDSRWQPLEYIDAMCAVDLQSITSRQDANDAMQTVIDDARLRLFLMTNLQRVPSEDKSMPDTWRWRVNLDAIREHIDDLGGFTTAQDDSTVCDRPVLFVRGEHSFYVNDAQYANSVSSLFPAYSYATVMNAGHWCHTDNTDGFVRVTREFLAP